jgi:hypothetical protein
LVTFTKYKVLSSATGTFCFFVLNSIYGISAFLSLQQKSRKKSRNLAVAIAEFPNFQCRKLQAFVIGLPGYLGLTENAGHDNAKLEMTEKSLEGRKMLDLKLSDKNLRASKCRTKISAGNAENYTVL